MAQRPVAVVVDGPPTPAWQARAIEQLDSSRTLVVTDVRLAGTPRRPATTRLVDRADRHLVGTRADALAPTRHAPRISGTTAAATLTIWLADARPPPSLGGHVLRLRHGGRTEPPEIAFRRALLGGADHVTTEAVIEGDGPPRAMAGTVSGTRRFSTTLSRDLALWKLPGVVALAAEREPARTAGSTPLVASEEPIPSSLAVAIYAVTAWTRVLITRLLFVRPWSIRIRRRSPRRTDRWDRSDVEVDWGPSPVYADPFLFEHEGRHHLFCEEVPAPGAPGVIAHTELPANAGVAPTPRTVLAAAHHLSYPFVFSYEGEILMVPETAAARRVALYRAVDFPHRWTHDTDLLVDVAARDATIVEHADLLWMFTSIAADGASALEELHVFWAASVRGPWHAHPANPVVSDVRGARPAGSMFHEGGRLIRPAQDSSRRYGWAISFREVDVLTTDAYAEHEIDRLEPATVRDARATHHYTADGRFEAIDLRRRQPRRGARG